MIFQEPKYPENNPVDEFCSIDNCVRIRIKDISHDVWADVIIQDSTGNVIAIDANLLSDGDPRIPPEVDALEIALKDEVVMPLLEGSANRGLWVNQSGWSKPAPLSEPHFFIEFIFHIHRNVGYDSYYAIIDLTDDKVVSIKELIR